MWLLFLMNFREQEGERRGRDVAGSERMFSKSSANLGSMKANKDKEAHIDPFCPSGNSSPNSRLEQVKHLPTRSTHCCSIP